MEKTSLMTQTHLHCPNCHQMDHVQKVSATASLGTASGVYTGFGNGVGYSPNGPVYTNEYIALSGNSQTTLGRLLSPPPQPTFYTFYAYLSTSQGTYFALFSIVFIVMGLLILLYG